MIRVNPDTLKIESVLTFTLQELDDLNKYLGTNAPTGLQAKIADERVAFWAERDAIMEEGARLRLASRAQEEGR